MDYFENEKEKLVLLQEEKCGYAHEVEKHS